jgi:hypothetical protein
MMQVLLWIVLFMNYAATSAFLTRQLLQAASSASSASTVDPDSDAADTEATGFPGTLFTPFNIEAAGAYTIEGYNGVRNTYPYNQSDANRVSTSSFAIDPAQKKLVFNQGTSGNQYVFDNGTYITLNVSRTNASVPLLCSYLPYVNYTQEVAAIANLTLQDIYYQKNSNTASGFQKVNLYSSVSVDASSCGTMISFTIATTGKGFIRGIYASEPFHNTKNGTPTNVTVDTSALIFDTTTLNRGVPDPSYFQLPANCFPDGTSTPTPINYCAATGFGTPPNLVPVCNLFPPIQ